MFNSLMDKCAKRIYELEGKQSDMRETLDAALVLPSDAYGFYARLVGALLPQEKQLSALHGWCVGVTPTPKSEDSSDA